MPGFSSSADIVNRALQRIGQTRITALSDNTKTAREASFCYDKLRRAELRRNIWRFATRRVIMRAIGTAVAAWDSTVTYAAGAFVSENGLNYISATGANTGNDPSTDDGSNWTLFTGNTTLKVAFTAWGNDTSYVAGNVATGSDGLLYLALVASSNIDPTTDTTQTWNLYFGNYTAVCFDPTSQYNVGEIVFAQSDATQIFYCTINGNSNDPVSSGVGWVLQGATAAPIVIPWPAGTGPSTDQLTKNVFVLPSGFMRMAPQDPSAGRTSFLGFPSNLPATDWVLEGPYILSIVSGPIMLRFVADVQDVTMMDDMFCEGLGCRVAMELCETFTQSAAKLAAVASEYKQFMSDARDVNGIEEGAIPPPLDDYILTRY